ncbi:MAG: protoheme IX farnesyltransferase, partial [Deltaproteobacteria bacterium]|nr:protoheme IX farnesyltransferase [Deltaproteobacteria bacterium]
MNLVSAYLNLTKPKISVLFAFTAIVGLNAIVSVSLEPLTFWMIVLGVFFIGAAANALNQYFERDIDARMKRTAQRRSLPLKKISPRSALIFSLVLCLLGVALLYIFGNVLASLLGASTIVFYSFFYTLYLKPRTPYNIVIGGMAGSMGPVLAWVAATGSFAWEPIIMFLIIFFWSPPHFWALSLYYKDDYASVGLPMLPVIKGETETRKQIFIYSLTLLPLTLSLLLTGVVGWFYAAVSFFSTLLFIIGAFVIYKNSSLLFCKKYF